MGFLSDGKRKEKEFVDLVSKNHHELVYPTTEQDINEHWDIQINNVRFDIKGLKKISRSDAHFNSSIHWIEIKNVHGKSGWLYGMADYISFETNDSWLIVKRSNLIKMVEDKLIMVFTDAPQPYKMYSRKGRHDVLTIVPIEDLKGIKTREVKK